MSEPQIVYVLSSFDGTDNDAWPLIAGVYSTFELAHVYATVNGWIDQELATPEDGARWFFIETQPLVTPPT